MSTSDAITAALIYNGIRRPTRNTGVSVSDYNSLMDSYEEQLHIAETYKNKCISVAKKHDVLVDKYDLLADNATVLLAYINSERMIENKEMLTMGDIRSIVNNNILISSFAQKILDQACNGDYSISTDETQFWDNIKNVVYKPLKEQIINMGDAGKKAIEQSYDRNELSENYSNEQFAAMEKRIAELEHENRKLKEKNKDLIHTTDKLKSEKRRLQEELLSDCDLDIDSLLIPNIDPNRRRG